MEPIPPENSLNEIFEILIVRYIFGREQCSLNFFLSYVRDEHAAQAADLKMELCMDVLIL